MTVDDLAHGTPSSPDQGPDEKPDRFLAAYSQFHAAVFEGPSEGAPPEEEGVTPALPAARLVTSSEGRRKAPRRLLRPGRNPDAG